MIACQVSYTMSLQYMMQLETKITSYVVHHYTYAFISTP